MIVSLNRWDYLAMLLVAITFLAPDESLCSQTHNRRRHGVGSIRTHNMVALVLGMQTVRVTET